MRRNENQNIEFKESWHDDALREAVINAVIHRDYIGSQTQLKVYDDRLILWNSGKLIEGITLDSLKKEHPSCLRNELLADTFFKAGLIEAWGRGTVKMIERCKEKKLPVPRFSELAGGFCVVFFKSREAKRLKGTSKTVEKILELMKENPRITIKQLTGLAGLSRRGIEWNIDKLKKEGKLERRGSPKGGYWRVKEKLPLKK